MVPGYGLWESEERGDPPWWNVEGIYQVPSYGVSQQYGKEYNAAWLPGQMGSARPQPGYVNPYYLTELMQLRDRVRAGQAQPYEVDMYNQQVRQAMAVPMRDLSTLKYGSATAQELEADPGAWQGYLDLSHPDFGAIMLTLRDKIDAGTATPQERELYGRQFAHEEFFAQRAAVPQESDVGFGFGDNLFSALAIAGLGTGFAGLSAGLTTLPGILSATGLGSTVTGTIGQATGSEALQKISQGLSLAGGLASLGGALSSGVSSIGDVLKLGQKAYGTARQVQGLVQSSSSGDGKDTT